ncbi:MAG: UbiX family flavin prenyltransferase [Lachnospiraceae bacterium]|jgi:4-hydroxy-3-polyprenylbenzoate decarboxylase|nr:UbiX family flavin prenyltransferase [Lachnospiraceae bacterium]
MRLIVAVTGASGVEMSLTLVRMLKSARRMAETGPAGTAEKGSRAEPCEVHLILSEGAKLTWSLESSTPVSRLTDLCDRVYEESDLGAVISSGSYPTDGMIVMPCSMKTLAGIVTGYADNLVQRAADVCMKEGRKVVLVPREMPFSKLHLRNLETAAELGCVIVPPVLTFYSGQKTLQDEIDQICGKVLMQFGLTAEGYRPWTGT